MGGYVGATCAPIITGFVVDMTGVFLLALIIGGLIQLSGAIAILVLVRRPITGPQLDAMGPAIAEREAAD